MQTMIADTPASPFAIARFQSCTSELRRTIEHLRDVEQEMTDALTEMTAQEQPRERLLVAQSLLASLQDALADLDVFSPRAWVSERQAGPRAAAF